MTTTGATRGRKNRQARYERHERYLVAAAPCQGCGGPLVRVEPIADAPYFVCGKVGPHGPTDQRCPGLRRDDGSVLPPDVPDHWGVPF